MSRKLPFFLTALYLLPWGIQCLVNNFIPVYVASLPFATEQTVGDAVGLGAVITTLSQLLWSFWASKAKSKTLVLSVSLLFLSGCSLLFLTEGNTKPLLFLFIVLFYSCYMAHQPLIDTIASENYAKTRFSFGFYRSFASLGYALMAILLVFLPSDNVSVFFLYASLLALLSLFCALAVPTKSSATVQKKKGTSIFNGDFIRFLLYTVLLFFCSSAISAFFSVYYTSSEHLGGSIESFSLLISISALAEWLLVMAAAVFIPKLGARVTFAAIPIVGIFRAFMIFIAPSPTVAALSFVGCALWFGILWAAVTPYVKSIVPPDGDAFAQGVWNVAASGLGSFLGSFVGGRLAEAFGLRTLFLIVTFVLLALALLTPLLIKKKESFGKEINV